MSMAENASVQEFETVDLTPNPVIALLALF